MDQIGRTTNQTLSPVYGWNNIYKGNATPKFSVAAYGNHTRAQLFHILENRDFYNNAEKPGYASYTYPHPLQRGELLADDRVINWSFAGIPGGVPNRTVICANVKSAPYNAYGDGMHDDTVAIQLAIDSCSPGQVVYLPSGMYKISVHNLSGWERSLYIQKGITLRGEGPGKTYIIPTGRAIILGGGDPTNYIDIISGYQKGSTSMTLASKTFTSSVDVPTALSVGNYLIIDQENDNATTVVTSTGSGGTCTWCGLGRCSSNHSIVDIWGSIGSSCDSGRGTYEGGKRSLGQIIRVTSINGNTITFEPELYWNYVHSAEPKVSKLRGMIEYAGIEDLTVNDTNSRSDYTIGMSDCAYCWLRNVEIANTWRYGVNAASNYRNEFRGNYFHHAHCYPGNYGYGISFMQHGTANLVENNVFDNLHVPIAREGGGGGNVYAYNYFDHGRYNSHCGPDAVENVAMPTAIVPHGAHPVFDLLEGNVAYQLNGDYYWGTSSHFTMFRNRVIGYDPTYYENMVYSGYHYRMEAVSAIPLAKYQRYMNIMGNILGTSGVSTTYELENPDESNCWHYTAHFKYVYHLGYVSEWNCNLTLRDALVRDTLIRHGNYDFVTNSTIWDQSIADRNLPASLYLESRPSWWPAELSWPSIGPDTNNPDLLRNEKIPAQLRFEAMSGQSFHRADSNKNNCVDISELLSFISRWKVSNVDVSLREIIEAIGLWKGGCG